MLVDTGHHYQAQNIEQIVSWLLADNMLGGFHFNDRRYADDDLTLGSIDPYQIFRIFHEIRFFEWETGQKADIAYMIDQSHNLKGKIEAMIQTVTTAQELFAKAAIVDLEKLTAAQKSANLVAAENCLKDAFSTDVRPAIREWSKAHGMPEDPLTAFHAGGYLEQITPSPTKAAFPATRSSICYGVSEDPLTAFHTGGYLEQITPRATRAALPATRSSICYVHARRSTCRISCQWLSGADHSEPNKGSITRYA